MEVPITQVDRKPFLSNDLYVDPTGYQVKLGQREIDLTLKEFNLLYLLISHKGKVVRRSEILQTVSASGLVNEEGALNVMVCRLRKKIESFPHQPKRIVLVRGLGYRFKG